MSADLTPIRLRVTSDGTLGGSQLVDAESGRPLTCASAMWTVGGDEMARLTIVVLDFEVEAQGAVTTARKKGGLR